jgi:hypothetical protein
MCLRGDGHGSSGLAGPYNVEPAIPWWLRQVRGEADVRVGRRDRCVVERQQCGTRSGLRGVSGHGLRGLPVLRLICA